VRAVQLALLVYRHSKEAEHKTIKIESESEREFFHECLVVKCGVTLGQG
jgi:hypothetical protein